jgi:hypothetical protein
MLAEKPHDPEFIAEFFHSGEYSYKTKISRQSHRN